MYWFAKTWQFGLAINCNLHCTANCSISGFYIWNWKEKQPVICVLTRKLILTVTTWNSIIIAYVTRKVTAEMKPTVWLSKYLVSQYNFMINLDATSLNICWNLCVFIRFLHAIPFSLSKSRSFTWRLLTQGLEVWGCLFGHRPSDRNASLGGVVCCGALCCARPVPQRDGRGNLWGWLHGSE